MTTTADLKSGRTYMIRPLTGGRAIRVKVDRVQVRDNGRAIIWGYQQGNRAFALNCWSSKLDIQHKALGY